MKNAYILWSTLNHGWLSGQGNYTTRLDDASKMSREEAINRAAAHYQRHLNEYRLLPVRLVDIEEVNENAFR